MIIQYYIGNDVYEETRIKILVTSNCETPPNNMNNEMISSKKK